MIGITDSEQKLTNINRAHGSIEILGERMGQLSFKKEHSDAYPVFPRVRLVWYSYSWAVGVMLNRPFMTLTSATRLKSLAVMCSSV